MSTDHNGESNADQPAQTHDNAAEDVIAVSSDNSHEGLVID